ncbi:hypothetical protein SO694_00126078 [Aureococcus anophagefferens]|uniref:Bardet-Biedl syndrome 2 protein homolog n=1 Tax=Aureococcus anophagefferens TaxID=44056 RepID=A0ABR1G2M5_AURAN
MECVFKIKLKRQFEARLCVVGCFDGHQPAVACATGSCGQVLLYYPHEQGEHGGSDPEMKALNFNKALTSLGCGPLNASLTAREVIALRGGDPEEAAKHGRDPDAKRDVLLVGMSSALLVYDVEMNSDVFYKEVQDGVNCMCFGTLRGVEEPLVIVGGNCSVLGFDWRGAEEFWTVTGDNVRAVAAARPGDGEPGSELLVGSDDYEIRVFQHEEAVTEATEADKVVALAGLDGGRFAFGLANGTIGVYRGAERKWRVKSKHALVALAAHDVTGDGAFEIIAGWSTGALTVRVASNGSVIYRDGPRRNQIFNPTSIRIDLDVTELENSQVWSGPPKPAVGFGTGDGFKASVAAVLWADLRMSGAPQVVGVSVDGELRGYVAVDATQVGRDDEERAAREQLGALQARKRELLLELRSLEDTIRHASGDGGANAGATNRDKSSFEFVFATTNGTFVSSVVVLDTDGGLFDGETLVAMPAHPTSSCALALFPRKNFPANLKIQIHVGSRPSSKELHVFEVDYELPKFCCFLRVEDPRHAPQPTSYVQFSLPVTLPPLAEWIEKSFVNMEAVKFTGDSIQVYYVSIRRPPARRAGRGARAPGGDADAGAPKPLWFEARQVGGQVNCKVSTNEMATAAEVVQDLAAFVDARELESVADFPAEMTALEDILSRVAKFNAIRIRLTADMADGSARIKALVLKAEDARLMADMPLMKRHYAELFALNNELIAEYNKRANNHEALLAALKDVNQIIQKASNLRAGAAKSRVVAEARAAIKTNAIDSLYQIVCEGRSKVSPAQ